MGCCNAGWLGVWGGVDGDFSLGHSESETLVGHLDGNAQ